MTAWLEPVTLSGAHVRLEPLSADHHDDLCVGMTTYMNIDAPNRRAIERLGAKLDGVLRSHQLNRHPQAHSSLRDTCVYSIIAAEWPAVRAHLDHQLAATGQA